ncbi:hypothetical protein FE257_007609 [Aspergillus nanangensis]|uniref:Adipose-regulatory protein-domain-containing protein n=1 Tax=Aspergillus nanangensis TaxID=2582783 RepID=A0AAD4GTZ2_ASPNN|nr:hypothetical protein FE257_007609 [Aspergillus nanangensis]
MDPQYAIDNGDDGDDGSFLSSVKDSLFDLIQPLVSKKAQKTYVGIFVFIATSIAMVLVSSFAYGVFYYSFIPQIGIEREIHLQFGDGDPWGIANIGSGLISRQPYDVSIKLELPRTPSNLATGNFMLDLALLPHPSVTALPKTNTSTLAISRSRRPAILTFNSQLVDTASKLTFMPFYVTGWNREAERLHVIKAETDGGKSIKKEPSDEPTSPLVIPSGSLAEGGRVKREEEYQADDESDDSEETLAAGTGIESAEARGLQRRRSHQFKQDDH